MRRLFWMSVGAVGGVAVSRKVRQTARKATPSGAAENVSAAIRELAGAIGAFGAEVRAGMAEREEQLADMVHERTGVSTGWPRHSVEVPRARRGASVARSRAPRASG